MAKPPTSTQSSESPSDLALLWDEALTEYYKTANIDPRRMPRYRNMTEIMRDQDVQEKFEKYRHKGGKVDKLRSLISSNADLIVKSAEYVASAASAAFPPSTVIVSAFALVLKASTDVSKDYDVMTSFFDELNDFLQRIQILEEKLPQFAGFRNPLIRVFSTILQITALIKMATQEGRFKRWGKNILRGGGDEELNGATAALEKAFRRLELATGVTTLAGVQDVKEGVRQIGDKQDLSYNLLSDVAANIQSSHAETLENFQVLATLGTKFDQLVKKLGTSTNKSDSNSTSQNVDPGLRRQNAFNAVNRVFPHIEPPTSQRNEIRHTLIDGTGQWFMDHERLHSWMEVSDDRNILCLNGQAGIGKSFLAHLATRKVELATASNSEEAVASIFLRDLVYEKDVARAMLCSIINQIASRDPQYCEQVAASLDGLSLEIEWNKKSVVSRLWEEHIFTRYHSESSLRLFLILDGVDECSQEKAQTAITNVLRKITEEKLHIQVLLTCRPGWQPEVLKLKQHSHEIEIVRNNIFEDLQSLVETRLRSSSRLYRCRKATKRLIASQILAKADSLLFAENVLHFLNDIHQEELLLKELETLPESLTGVFEHVEQRLIRRRRSQQVGALKMLFAWLAFANRLLTVSDANALLRMQFDDPFFSFEEELSGASGAFLEIVSTYEEESEEIDDDQEVNETEAKGWANDLTGYDFPSPATETGASVIRFRSRSLREFFASGEHVEGSLRSARDDAHATILGMSIGLLCDTGVQSLDENQREIGRALLYYAVESWPYHLKSIDISALTEHQTSRVVQSIRLLLTNTNNAAATIEKHIRLPKKTVLDAMGDTATWAEEIYFQGELAVEPWLMKGCLLPKELFSEEENAWLQHWQERSKESVLAELSYGHIRNWLKDPGETAIGYVLGVMILKFRDKTFRNQWDELQFMESIAGKTVVKVDCAAYKSMGLTLKAMFDHDQAVIAFERALSVVADDLEKASILTEIANAGYWNLYLGDDVDDDSTTASNSYEHYGRVAQSAIDIIPESQRKDQLALIRRCLLIRGDCEWESGKLKESIQTYDDARNLISEETMTATAYHQLAQRVHQHLGGKAFMEWFQKSDLFESMAWICTPMLDLMRGLDYDDNRDFHLLVLYNSARLLDKEETVEKTFEAIINVQQLRDGAARMQYRLAYFYKDYYFSHHDANAKAKALLYKVLKSKSQKNLMTGLNESWLPAAARNDLTEVLYEQFRSTSDSAIKHSILEEMRKLQEENVNSTLQNLDPSECSTSIQYACMLRKSSSNIKFQEVLDDAFGSCIAGLTDADGANDQASLLLLAKVLACVPGMGRDARIAYSAQYSILDPKVTLAKADSTHGQGDEATKGSDPSSKYKKHNKWGDILPDPETWCERSPYHNIKHWQNAPTYLCITCVNTQLCSKCFETAQQVNRGEKEWPKDLKRACATGHRYVKGPIEGWKGVRDGVIVIETDGLEERTPFQEWLEGLKGKWKLAWEEFWKREELVDVLE